ncbi:zinc finger protein 91 [Corythoichthys intestinalis]|uniref:zinc finger protein 91 n=1 Tax=Corythoichthys intestinalis TaxID=161448 RepID=UPI0025A59A59|nr:zinc finger protein 91 [Corythoichthys intestinalis]
MPQCSAFGCRNRSDGKYNNPPDVSFHAFPLRKEALIKLWLKNVGRLEFTPSKSSKLCSAHFRPSCFQSDPYEKYGLESSENHRPKKRMLKEDAVPTEFSLCRTQRVKRASRASQKKKVERQRLNEQIICNPLVSKDLSGNGVKWWELKRHADKQCTGSEYQKSNQAFDTALLPSPETSREVIDYDYTKPLDSDDLSTDDSTKSAGEDEGDFHFKRAQGGPSYKESDDDNNSSSTESAYSSGVPTLPDTHDSFCNKCDQGPFTSMKLHLKQCSGALCKETKCFRCMMPFRNEAALKDHYSIFYYCDVCGQVFRHWAPAHQHKPPERALLRLIRFCSVSTPKVCAICKSFFLDEKSLSTHVICVHTSVVSTHVHIVKKQSCLTDKKVSTNVVAASTPEPVVTNQVIDKDHTYCISAPLKSVITGWCFKVPRPCWQCGTMLRQPYLAISHRYLHRGRRLHRCYCGRSFKHRLHLLRHCVQHAEDKSYICVNCGNTFAGARLLAAHLRGKTQMKKKGSGNCRKGLACSCGHYFNRASAFIWHQIKNNVKTRHLKRCK